MLLVVKIPVEPLQSNCYLVWVEDSGIGVVIDPGGEGAKIIEEIERREMRPQYILNTHCHGDHVAANGPVKERFGIPLLVPREEAALLADPNSVSYTHLRAHET